MSLLLKKEASFVFCHSISSVDLSLCFLHFGPSQPAVHRMFSVGRSRKASWWRAIHRRRSTGDGAPLPASSCILDAFGYGDTSLILFFTAGASFAPPPMPELRITPSQLLCPASQPSSRGAVLAALLFDSRRADFVSFS
jgi:hypothetical protein